MDQRNARLDKALIPWQREPVASEFRAAFDSTLFHETETEA